MIALALAAAAFVEPTVDTDAFLRAYGNLRTDKSGAAIVDVVISPAGRLESCRHVQFFGSELVAASTCSILQTIRWKAGTDASGQPVQWRMRTMMKMLDPNSDQGKAMITLKRLPDLDLKVSRMPAGVAPPLDIRLYLQVDGTGVPSVCQAKRASSAPEQLVKLACDQASRTAAPPQSAPTAHVTFMDVRFTA
jgi:hypothetical protein